MADATWAQVAGTVFVGVVGLWLAHNYRRQVGLKLAERRIDAYIKLWTLLAVATPVRTTPLDPAERTQIHDDMNHWYFTDGNGLYMSTPSRDLFMAVQANLTCPIPNIRPVTLAARLATMADADAERQLGCIGIRHISLLRTQLKADVNLHIGVNFYRKLRWIDRDLLRSCGLSPWRPPWRRRLVGIRGRVPRRLRTPGAVADSCVCGFCGPR